MRFRRAAVLFMLAVAAPTLLKAGILTFEGFPDSTIFTSQYPGLAFSNTIILTAGITLNEFEFPPHSGTNVASDNGGPITITFTSPVQNFSGYLTYGHSLAVQAFGPTNTLVASAVSKLSNNEALSGATSSQPNELIQVSVPAGISKVTIAGDPAGSSFALDDINTTGVPISPTPAPPTLFLMLVGLIGVLATTRKGRISAGLKFCAACSLILALLGVGAIWMTAEAQTRTTNTSDQRRKHLGPNPYLLKSKLAATPDKIVSGRDTVVTFTAHVNHLRHIPGSVNLLRLDPSGNATIMDRLNVDTGGNYVSRVRINEHLSGEARFQISIAIRGEMRRLLSEPITLTIISSK